MNEGFIALHRKIMEWEWYSDGNTFRLFVHCLLRANHADNRWRGHLIKRGQFISSISILSGELGLTIKQIRGSLDKLKRTGEVASESSSQFTVFTVKKYDDYQSAGKPEGKPTASERANEGQAEGKRGATNNNDNNDNNDNNNNNELRDSSSEVPPDVDPVNPPQKYKFSEDHLAFATGMFSMIKRIVPRARSPSFESWANTIRLMEESDGYPLSEMADVFRFANQDEFWSGNILSPKKFRTQYATLHHRMTAAGGRLKVVAGTDTRLSQNNQAVMRRFVEAGDRE